MSISAVHDLSAILVQLMPTCGFLTSPAHLPASPYLLRSILHTSYISHFYIFALSLSDVSPSFPIFTLGPYPFDLVEPVGRIVEEIC